MSEARYDIYFRGDLLEGFYADFVKADMAQLFKTDPARLEAFFSGKPQPVKLKVDRPTAAKYKAALEKIGAKPIIVPMGEAIPAGAARPEVSASTPQQQGSNAGSVNQPVTEPGSTSDWTVLPAGSDIGEHRDIQPVSVDTTSFSLAQTGATLVEHPERPTPVQVDISGLSLDEPGVTLVENPERPTPAQVDLSGLSLDEPGVTLVASDRTVPPPPPDISHLKLE
ncbi:hypothetical protein [Saccharospirillum alexandrii]|uniref:hypothetical protein n=1 Tax=Saccharospirillum alexandrii TaxID=2448477 RepID=UPI00173AA05A